MKYKLECLDYWHFKRMHTRLTNLETGESVDELWEYNLRTWIDSDGMVHPGWACRETPGGLYEILNGNELRIDGILSEAHIRNYVIFEEPLSYKENRDFLT